MSLINKMLQDLESRTGAQENTASKKNAYEGLKSVKTARLRTPPRRLIAMIFTVSIIGAGAYAWMQWGDLVFSGDKLANVKPQPVSVRRAAAKPASVPAPASLPNAGALPVVVAKDVPIVSAPAPTAKAEKPTPIAVAQVQPEPAPVAPPVTPAPEKIKPVSTGDGYWTVSKGETLYAISAETGVNLWDLSTWNHLGRHHTIHVGQRLRLTPSAASVAKPEMNQPEVKQPEKNQTAKKKEKVFVASADNSMTDGAPTATAPNPADAGVMNKKPKPLSPQEKSEDAYRLAANLLQQGRSSDAEKHLHLALNADAEHTKARELLAGLALQSGHKQEAEQLLEQGIAKVPAHFPFAQLLARVYVDRGSEQKALAVMEASRKAGAGSADYTAFLAALYQRAGQHPEAVKAYTEAVTIEPQASRSWLGMGISLEAMQDWNAASAAYQRAIDSATLDGKLLQYAQQRLKIVKNKGS